MRHTFLPVFVAFAMLFSACGNITVAKSSVEPGTKPVTDTTHVTDTTGDNNGIGDNGKTVLDTLKLTGTILATTEDSSVKVHLSAQANISVARIPLVIVAQPQYGTLSGVPDFLSGTHLTATFVYTPAPNFNGQDGFTVKAVSGTTEAVTTILVTVTPVNDPPSFEPTTLNLMVTEDSGPYSQLWATAIKPGPPNEANQTTTFALTSDNAGLFQVQPAISQTGQLSFTPAVNAFGQANVTVVLHDDGGTANAGSDTFPVTFTITVIALNDPPSFAGAASLYTWEDTGAVVLPGWLTSIVAGPPNEAGQAVTFAVVPNSNPSLFAEAPTVSSNGTLYFTPTDNAFGVSNLTVTAFDTGGGDHVSVPHWSRIEVLPVNDKPYFSWQAAPIVYEDSGPAVISTWATPIAGPANEVQTFWFGVTTDHPELFAQLPTIDSSGNLYLTPLTNVSGMASMSITLYDSGNTLRGGVTSYTAITNITILPVNTPPSFTAGGNENILEDAGLQTVAGWASAITFGPANEAPQSVSFAVTTDAPGLFLTQPAVASNGELTYTPAANANGSALLVVTAWDSGGTTNGGSNTSAPAFAQINIAPVNDAPNFVTSNVLLLEDAGAQTHIGWAAPINAGPPNETGQGLLPFLVSNNNNALFAVQPTLATDGTLTFTSAPNANGIANVTAILTDGGGTANGGTDTRTQYFDITITPVNDPPTTVPDTASTTLNTPVNIPVLNNDSDIDGDTLTLFGFLGATSGTLWANPDQSIRYTPNYGYVGTDSFSYGVSDGIISSVGTVTVTITGDTHAPQFLPASSWPRTGTLLNTDTAYGSGKQFGPATFVFDDTGLVGNAVTVAVTQAGVPLSNGTDFSVNTSNAGQIQIYLGITSTSQAGDTINFSLSGISDINGNWGNAVTVSVVYDAVAPWFYNNSYEDPGWSALLYFNETVTSAVTDPVHFVRTASGLPVTVEPNHNGIMGQGWTRRTLTRDTYFFVPRDRLTVGDMYRIEATQFTDMAGNAAVGSTLDSRTICCSGASSVKLLEINFVNRPTGTTIYQVAPGQVTNNAFNVTRLLAGTEYDVDVVLDQPLDTGNLEWNQLFSPWPSMIRAVVTAKSTYNTNDTIHLSLKDADPGFAWTALARYRLGIGVQATGGGWFSQNFSFYVRSGSSDVTAPAVSGVAALRGIAGATTQIIRYEEPLIVGFSEQVDVTSFNSKSVQIWRDYGGGGTAAVPAAAILDEQDDAFKVRAIDSSGTAVPLTAGSYWLVFDGIEDLATPPNASGNIRIPFLVMADDIPVAPQFVTSSPQQGDVRVDPNFNISLAFTDRMSPESFRDDGSLSGRGYEFLQKLGNVWIPRRMLKFGDSRQFDISQILQLQLNGGAQENTMFRLTLLPGLYSSGGVSIETGSLPTLEFSTTTSTASNTQPVLESATARYSIYTENVMTLGPQVLETELDFNAYVRDYNVGDQWTFRVSDATGDMYSTGPTTTSRFESKLTGAVAAPLLATAQTNYYWLAITDSANNTVEMINAMWVMHPQTATDAAPAVTDAGNGVGTFRFYGTVSDTSDAAHILKATIYVLPVETALTPPMAVGVAYVGQAQITRNLNGTLSYELSLPADQALTKQSGTMRYMVGVSLQSASVIGFTGMAGEIIAIQPTPFNVP